MTHVPHEPCPGAETLAAFAEGWMSGREAAAIVEHLDTCDECMGDVALAMKDVDEARGAPDRPPAALDAMAPRRRRFTFQGGTRWGGRAISHEHAFDGVAIAPGGAKSTIVWTEATDDLFHDVRVARLFP